MTTEATTIQLGGEEIAVYDLSIARLRDWRIAARPILDAHDTVIEAMRSAKDVGDDGAIKAVSLQFEEMVDEHIVTMLSLVLDWLPDQSRRDELGESAAIDEVLGAFLVLARKVYRSSADFFIAMLHATWAAGSTSNQTGTNSPEASGDSGRTTSDHTSEANSSSPGSSEKELKLG